MVSNLVLCLFFITNFGMVLINRDHIVDAVVYFFQRNSGDILLSYGCYINAHFCFAEVIYQGNQPPSGLHKHLL